MLLQTFTLLLLSATALTLTSPPEGTTETPPASSQSPNQTPIGDKEEHFPAEAPAQAEQAALVETQPGFLQPPLSSMPTLEAEDAQRRRLITYDQRQEGQYNIRADLENFMIVLIPPGPQEGLSLLDLLTKSSLRSGTKGGQSKRKHALKSFYQRQQLQQQQQQLQQQQLQPQQQLPISDFIEGRTPYHVDISAVSEEQQQQHPRLHREQVDVLPPQLLPLPQLIKPFHLEAEPELIQALPPVVASGSTNKLLESYNQMGSHYYRNSRSLGGDNFLDTNRLTPEFSSSFNARAISVPIYRSDVAHANRNANALYPPIDVPAYIVNEAQPRLWQLDDEPTPIRPKHLIDGDVLNFELLNDSLADSKALLRDGDKLARCAPGQRRDSYGACRQLEGY
ncbi:forkhead box protein P2 [Drosophila innubila]|uniref:forkhead box protein P2 n=1 Tax=Drosophila innubila TaxID=198719 RepID=UPI00148BE622|nr:forkhead box protein P2 [Drosophila innubila]